MKIKDLLLTFCKYLGIVVLSALIGVSLLLIAYSLPVEYMSHNLIESERTLRMQDDATNFANKDYSKMYDTGTNIIMLYEMIVKTDKSAFYNALYSPSAGIWSGNWTDQLMSFAENGNDIKYDYKSYARYWHGYLVFLKPLFLFFNLQEIYQLNSVVILILIAIVFALLNKRVGYYSYAYLISICTMNPMIIMNSFQLSTVFYALHVTMIILLSRKKWSKSNILYIFLIDGILVAFLDFLTYPVVALTIPLLTSFLLEDEKHNVNFIWDFIKRCIVFFVGYAGMWGMKWVLATIFTKENVIFDAIVSVLDRTGVQEKNPEDAMLSIGIDDAILRNLETFFNKNNLLILLIGLISFLLIVCIKKCKFRFSKNKFNICFLTAFTAIVWLSILSNHSSLHPHLEWRTCTAIAYALCVYIISLFAFIKEENVFRT